MRKLALIAAAVFSLAGGGAKAGIVGFANEFSGGVQCANLTTGCAIMETTAIAGGVHFALLGTMTGTEFITGLYGNIDPFATPTVANLAGKISAVGGGFQFGQDSFKADGDGFFDWFLDLSSNPPRFDGNSLLTWDFMGITLADLNGLSVNGSVGKTGFQYAIHAQGLLNGGSGWDSQTGCPGCTITPVNSVPEPGSLALAGSGLVALGAFLRRKEKKTS